MARQPDIDTIIARTRCWIEKAVVGLNLCPFARKPFEAELVRYVVSTARSEEELFADLQHELAFLQETDADVVETTVLIHPYVLTGFIDYNNFLNIVDALIEQEYPGEFQVASLHPHYQFADTRHDDTQNYTNRSPYPILHLLREAEVARAIASYARPDKIPERNIRVMEERGAAQMQALLDECMKIGT